MASIGQLDMTTLNLFRFIYILNIQIVFPHFGLDGSLKPGFDWGCRCGGTQTGSWSVDGLLGFGPTTVSLPNQLAQQNISVNIFAHCLQGDVSGRGSLVIGTIREPDLVYTPMVFGE